MNHANPLFIDYLVDRAIQTIRRCELDAPGKYKRYVNAPGDGQSSALNEYGVADAANLLYTLGHFPRDQRIRDGFIHTLQSMQNPDTGLWHESTHHDYHCTAHCIAALELFDARSLYPLKGLDNYRTPEGIQNLLNNLDWTGNPWSQSHQGAGVFASLLIADVADEPTRNAYFNWLEENCDPDFGLLRKGCLPGQHPDTQPLHHHMAGTFHYLFNIEADRRPLPFASKLVDTCLDMHQRGDAAGFAKAGGFILIDWVFCLSRGVRHSGHRFAESKIALEQVARAHFDHLRSIDLSTNSHWNDLHTLFGAACAWSELQLALPGLIRTRYPLKNVMDRRPFI